MVKIRRLNGFLIDVHCISESNLEVELDCSSLSWQEYSSLIHELEDLLSNIDERYSARSWLTRGRGLKARYKRVTAEDRRRKLRFSPFPSRFQNTLKNLRAYVYELVAMNCIVIEKVGRRKTYFLPKPLAPSLIYSIERINEVNIEKLRREVEEFRKSDDYLAIKNILYKHGLDPEILDKAYFHIGKFTVDIIPVDFNYNIDVDEVYRKMKKAEALKGLESLKKHIERKYREYALNVAKDIISRITVFAEEYDRTGGVIKLKNRIKQLIELADAVGLTMIVEEVFKPILEICNAPKRKRKEMIRKKFGTESLKEAVEKALSKQNMETVEYVFNPPISIDDGKVKWMEAKILEQYRKHGLKWRFKFVVGTNLVEKLQLTVPYDFNEERLEEIGRVVNWINKMSRRNRK